MSIIKTSLKVLTVSLALVMTGCGFDNISTGGPGTGGTGPIGPPIFTSSNVQLMASSSAVDAAKMDGISKPPAPKPIEPHSDNLSSPEPIIKYQVMQINKSVNDQYCEGFQRSITLIKKDKPVDKLTSRSDEPINIQIEVVNSTDSSLNEIKRHCNAFNVTDIDELSIIEPITDCESMAETIQYLPKQTHTYNIQLSNLNTAGQYTVSFLNEVEGMQNDCPTFIEFLVE